MQISAQTHHFSLLTRAICGFECHPVKHYITLVHRGEIEVQILVVSGDCMVHNLFFFFFLSRQVELGLCTCMGMHCRQDLSMSVRS